jgi:hypothetical protein
MVNTWIKWLGVVAISACVGLLLPGCGGDSGGDSGGGDGVALTNPEIPAGGGVPPRMDEMARWQNYAGEVLHQGKATAIKWPNSLYTLYGCTPANTRCVVDGTEFLYYQIDVYPTGAKMLSYGSTRIDSSFPKPFVAVLYKNGEPFAACQFQDPMVDNDNVPLPATINLPGWAD